MPRKYFDEKIHSLVGRMTDMGREVDERIGSTIEALRTFDCDKGPHRRRE